MSLPVPAGSASGNCRRLSLVRGADCAPRAGGNICYADTPESINREHAILGADRCVAVNPSDTAPALIALNASMVIRSANGERVVDAEEYFIGPGTDITRMPCSWKQCVAMFTEDLPWLSAKDKELIMGRALCTWLDWKIPG